MALGAIGVVFGDIGTSPMYAIKESLHTPGLPATPASVLGIVSLVLWSLLLVVTVKYLQFITLADNDGEGGIFALVSLFKSKVAGASQRMLHMALAIGIAATALLFADTLITPALSVMAATEGLALITPGLEHWAAGTAIVVLIGLFSIQRFGTAFLSGIFAPIMLVWFLVLAVLGALQIYHAPHILAALSPLPALQLLEALTWNQRMSLLGSILLAITGAEAIYADMGHFGRLPIARAWYTFALWSLLINYFGQGAWLLRTHAFASHDVNPFFQMVPTALMLPVAMLAVLASIIASQAVISGMFSMASQAITLHYLPRLTVRHTSAIERGQIYLPKINLVLAIGCVLLVIGFGSSDALASAYGFAVAATMTITTVAFTLVAFFVWRWSALKTTLFAAFALPLDGLFLAASIRKLPDSHYLTLLISLGVVFLLVVWRIGNRHLMERAQRLDMPVTLFADMAAERTDLHRQARPAVFFQHLPFPPDMEITPNALLRQVQLTSMLYQPTVIVEFLTHTAPRVADEDRIQMRAFGNGIYSLRLSFGFAEPPHIEPIIEFGKKQGWWQAPEEIVYYSGREDLRMGTQTHWPMLLKWPFFWLHRQDQSLDRALKLPAGQYAELGIRIDI